MTEYIVVGAPSGELGEEFMRLWLNGNSAIGREFICTYRCRANELYFVFRPVDNAALIAAASELLEACYEALDGMYDQHPQYETMTSEEMRHPEMDCYAVEVILDIRAAIAKAEASQ